MKNIGIFIVMILMQLPIFAAEKGQKKVIKMGTIVKEKDALFKKVAQFTRALSNEMGVTIELLSLPPKRGTKYLQMGYIDGEIARIIDYESLVPNSIRVQEPVSVEPYLVYTWKDSLELDGWESIKPYSIVTVSGYAFVDKYMKGFNTYAVNSIEQAFSYLVYKRADVFVMNRQIAETFLQTSGFKLEGVHKIEKPIDELILYTYFTQENKEIALLYEKALKVLKSNGVYNSIFYKK